MATPLQRARLFEVLKIRIYPYHCSWAGSGSMGAHLQASPHRKSNAKSCRLIASHDIFSNMNSPPRNAAIRTRPDKREHYLILPSNERLNLDLQGLELSPVRMLGRYRYSTAHPPLPDHSHGEMIEICYLETGTQTYVVEGREFPLNPGDVFMTFPGEVHSTGTHPEERGTLNWLLISVPAAKKSLLNLPRSEGDKLLQALLHPPARFFPGRESLRETLGQIIRAYSEVRNPLRCADLRNLLIRLLLDVVASSLEAHQSFQTWQIRAALDYIDAHAKGPDPLPLTKLAEHVKLSLPRLKSKFKEEVGFSPADYILRRKIVRAAQLLYETDGSILDIAMELGFPSSQYFATVFKRYTLHSPREARENHVRLS
jgi:AraC-like DNA-binding protein